MSNTDASRESTAPARRRRSDGQASRNAILREAAQLATVEGIEGLSISRLATAVGMSKSGLFAHFGSKQELQLATIDMATDLIEELVINPSQQEPTGIERLRRFTKNYLDHVEASIYPGGCFFASLIMEVDTQKGLVRDAAVEFLGRWLGLIESMIRDAQAEGSIDPSHDAAQLTFQVEAFMFLANAQFVVSQESTPIDRGRLAIDHLLAQVAPAA